MIQLKSLLMIASLPVLLSACVTTAPSTMVHQPMTTRPEPRPDSYATQGSIYNAGVGRPLFEDRRARYVGDTITINIVENTQASKNSETKASRDSSVDVSTPTIAGLPFKTFQGVTLNAGNSTAFDGSGPIHVEQCLPFDHHLHRDRSLVEWQFAGVGREANRTQGG